MDRKLEVVVVPVTDVDRAKAFYTDRIGSSVPARVRRNALPWPDTDGLKGVAHE